MPALEDHTDAPLPRLPKRRAESHKGEYGRALLVGGSRGMSGAISLAGMAALRSGAGLVTLAIPRTVQDVVAAGEPSYMTHGLPDDGQNLYAAAGDEVLVLAQRATAVALGPGLGRSEVLTALVERLYREIPCPLVVDADGLFALAQQRDVLTAPGGPRVLTPHAGEFVRLAGRPPAEAATIAAATDRARMEAAAELASRDASAQTVVVLKGHRSVITDGRRTAWNHTGNPGMATGGSGDSLTGILTALLCQGLAPWEAARLGAHVHGLAGDLAAAQLGQVSMIASDLIDFLPAAFQELDTG